MFVCSSALHVRLFAPAIRLLLSYGASEPSIVSLDVFYSGIHGNVASCVKQLGLPVPVRDAGFARGGGRNPLVRMLGSVFSAWYRGERAFRELFGRSRASLVVLGNDTGHAERAALRAARSLGIPTLLVQDGFLFARFSGGGSGSRLGLAAMRLWLSCGGDRIGAVPYGMGGCTYIAAHGAVWAEVFRKCRRWQTRQISVTGHPALELDEGMAGDPAGRDVAFFCTNYLSGHDDREAHRNQVAEILSLRGLMSERFGDTAVLRVKIHPADSEDSYAELAGVAGIVLIKDADLRGLIRSSWMCVTNISSVSLECLACGRVCLMSGVSIRDGRYRRLFSSLPGSKFAAWSEFLSCIQKLEVPGGYERVLREQREALRPYVDVQPGRSGATRLASLVAGLAENVTVHDGAGLR